MTITRDVIIDLLPVYAAGEASADTRALVEQYLNNDASLSALLRSLQAADRTNEAEHDPSPAVEREAINRTRAMIRRRGWTLGLAIFFTLVPFTFAWSGDRVTFFMLRDEPGSALFFVSALYLWWQYVRLGRKLRSTIP